MANAYYKIVVEGTVLHAVPAATMHVHCTQRNAPTGLSRVRSRGQRAPLKPRLLISGNETKALQNLHLFHFPPERVHGGP